MTAFISELVSYAGKFIFLLAVSVGGVLTGRKLSLRKKNKKKPGRCRRRPSLQDRRFHFLSCKRGGFLLGYRRIDHTLGG